MGILAACGLAEPPAELWALERMLERVLMGASVNSASCLRGRPGITAGGLATGMGQHSLVTKN